MTSKGLWHVYLFTLIFFFFSCISKNGKDSGRDNNGKDVKQLSADSVFNRFKRQPYLYTRWQNIYRQKDSTFCLDSFTYRSQYTSEFIYTLANMQEDYYKKYGRLFIYNPDSSGFIDIFSTYITITVDRTGHLHRGKIESEQEVAVVYKNSQRRYRIFFCSKPCFIASAAWIDDDEIALMGLTTELEDDSFIPTIWLINMSKNSTTEYSHSSPISSITPEILLDEVLTSKGIKKQN